MMIIISFEPCSMLLQADGFQKLANYVARLALAANTCFTNVFAILAKTNRRVALTPRSVGIRNENSARRERSGIRS